MSKGMWMVSIGIAGMIMTVIVAWLHINKFRKEQRNLIEKYQQKYEMATNKKDIQTVTLHEEDGFLSTELLDESKE